MNFEIASLHLRFRIGAFDHDNFAFVDATFKKDLIMETSPIVLFTNPTDSRYMVQGKTSLRRMRTSTHIRYYFVADRYLLANQSRHAYMFYAYKIIVY